MASWSKSIVSSTFESSSLFSSSSRSVSFLLSPSSSLPHWHQVLFAFPHSTGINHRHSNLCLSINKKQHKRLICRAGDYKFPDPIPEFAVAESKRFKTHLHNKLSRKDLYGDSLEEVIGICTEIFSTFLHSHYGGPGTLLVTPFIDMNDTINERDLPGGPQAARTAVKWAQDNVDKDWKEWNGSDSN